MSLTLDTLSILDAIDRRGSFARVAEERDRAQSNFTYAVQQLESELDVLVFDRSGHRARTYRARYSTPRPRAAWWKRVYLAWRSGDSGRTLAWFIQRLSQPNLFEGGLDAA